MNHDNSYKLLFSHARMVEDLIKGFVHEEWVTGLDFGTLEKVSGHFVADDLRDREDDIVWRLKWRGEWGEEWLYVYLLLEFQSTVDPHMAVRIMTYLGLLYQDIIRQGSLTTRGKLPPVLPVVLYNGKPRWRAVKDVADLIETPPGGLEHYRPRMSYLLLDEGALDETEQHQVKNLAAALFALEKSRNPEQIRSVVAALVDWLHAPEQTGLRRSFTIWIKRVLLPGRLPGIDIPQLNDLQEVNTMLAETVIEWKKDWKQQGRQEGEAAVLERQLTRRFGPLSAETRARLVNAPLDQLEQWADNILDAKSLEDVFDNH